jgi:formate dehydrogenase maturation protein FdhE
LRALVVRLPDLKEAAGLYEIVLPLLRDAEAEEHIAPVFIPSDQIRAKLAEGKPLLQDIGLELDHDKLRELMLRMATALERHGGKGRRQYRRIIKALEENRLDIDSLLASLAADDAVVASAAEDLQADPGLIETLVHNALKPALRSLCRQLTPLVDGIPWERGYCFVCGSGAAFGELQDDHLRKHLRCGQCGADWTFHRLRCSYCGNEDHRTLGLLYPDPWDGKARVEVCDKCKGYLKVIVSFTPTPAERLPVEDLATLPLDYIAQANGYTAAVSHNL